MNPNSFPEHFNEGKGTVKQNMKLDKGLFKHLEKTDPKIDSILNLPVSLVHDEHLSQLGTHFDNIKSSSNSPEVKSACTEIGSKIVSIVNEKGKWDVYSKSEIGKAANEPSYYQKSA